ncbi:MAG: DNA repair protein RecN [Bacteroidota bacterium]|nr:DNA repair protein RecN [Bacteroidota bacterium]
MLQSLTIKNYILINSLELKPELGLNIITGETGAGKSIILGAIGLLAGERADTKVLLNQEEKCIIEGVFTIEQPEVKILFANNDLDDSDTCIIRREISPQGKSRAFVNDTPVTLDVVKEIASNLLDVHSQHDNLLLSKANFQLNIIDLFAKNETAKSQYYNTYKKYIETEKKLVESQILAQESKKTSDYDLFILKELKEANLENISEQELLEQELEILEHAQEIKLKLDEAVNMLNESDLSINVQMGLLQNNISSISRIASNFESYKSRIGNAIFELKDITKELSKESDKIDDDPERVEYVKERLSTIYKLQKKHSVTDISGLIKIREALVQKTALIESSDELIKQLENQLKIIKDELVNQANELSMTRKNAFDEIEKPIIALLKELGMPESTFVIEQSSIDFTSTGIDKINMLFSANKGFAPVSLKNAASGGEFSRLMFALKYIMAKSTQMPTIIFDEIDTGISGEIARKMGNLMRKMAVGHQLITITHLHQIAARGNTHFYVYKSEGQQVTNTSIRKLSEDEKVQKIAEMIGGANPSSIAIQSAKEMLLEE